MAEEDVATAGPPDEAFGEVTKTPDEAGVTHAHRTGEEPVAHEAEEKEEDEGEEKEEELVDDDVPATFDVHWWRPDEGEYGINGLLRLRTAMMPIQQPEELATLKFLVIPSAAPSPEEERRPRDPESRGVRSAGVLGDRKGKGKGKAKEPARGRYVIDHGQTQPVHSTQRGQWWRNVEASDVVVRKDISLMSDEIFRVPPGHFVQQSAACEIFVSGQATGLTRMPVMPRGWVTVDASPVGGPRYLETIRRPTWRVCFCSGNARGDVVVRANLSLESEEVAMLMNGTQVEQIGPQELEDGIIRMPIAFTVGEGREPGVPSRPSARTRGWVTCDASRQGGPKFFEPLREASLPPARARAAAAERDDGEGDAGQPRDKDKGESVWKKNKIWVVTNLPESGEHSKLPILKEAEPFAPGSNDPLPREDSVVRWLGLGAVVEQVGHSKKINGYMIMPIRYVSTNGGSSQEGAGAEGWVTRRVVDKDKIQGGGPAVWFEMAGGDGEVRERERRRQGRDDPWASWGR